MKKKNTQVEVIAEMREEVRKWQNISFNLALFIINLIVGILLVFLSVVSK
jgi:hypothetical protein